LHTLQVFHADSEMKTQIKDGFQGVIIRRIRTLIIPEYCFGILKCCPQVTKLWCNHGDGRQLLAVIRKYCKKVQEIRGFRISADEKLVKSK
jgi:hypothetical protein